MTAYQEAQKYRQTVANKLKGLEDERTALQNQADQVAREMTSAAGLLESDKTKAAELKTIRGDLADITEQIQAIEDAGGLFGILKEDPRMNELAEAVYSENTTALNGLRTESAEVAAEIRHHLEHFQELEERANLHSVNVEALEKEIDELKMFMTSVSLPLKTSYRHKGARLPRTYSYVFSDIQKALENLQRESV